MPCRCRGGENIGIGSIVFRAFLKLPFPRFASTAVQGSRPSFYLVEDRALGMLHASHGLGIDLEVEV